MAAQRKTKITKAEQDPVPSEAKEWRVIHTKPAGEARAAASFKEQKFEVFFPQEVFWCRSGRTKTERGRPLIRGYIFAEIAETDLWKLREMDGVNYAVPKIGAYLDLVWFIDWVRREERIGTFDHTLAEKRRKGVVAQMDPGEQVRVCSGKYAGLTASFERLEGKGRARVMLAFLGADRSTSIELEHLEAA